MTGPAEQSPDRADVLRDPQRLAALRATGLLDTPPEEAFDRVTRLAARALDAPVSLVSLLDAERQFVKSAFGLDPRKTAPCHSFCRHVVAGGRAVVVDDARREALRRGGLPVEGPGIVAYAGVPLEDETGQRLGALCVIDTKPRRWSADDLGTLSALGEFVRTEITLRHRANGADARAGALERMATLVEAAQDAIIGKTLDGVITHWNPAAERMYGYSAEEAIGRSITMLAASPDQESEFAAIHARIADGEHVEHFETVRRRRDGSIVEVCVAVAPIRGIDGSVIGASTVASDITARREAERQHDRLAHLLAEAQELAGLGSWEIDLVDGRATWTDQVHTIFGVSPEAVSAVDSHTLPLRELIHPEDLDGYLRMVDRVTATGAPGQIEYRILRPDGHTRILQTRARRVVEGHASSLVGTVIDITDVRALEREATAARDRFAGVLDAATETSIIGTDPDGQITVFNRGAEKLLGWSAEEMIGRRTLTALHDIDELRGRAAELGIPVGHEVLVGCARSGRPETREWTYVRKDWTQVTVSLTVTALRHGEELGGFIAVARDVSQARSAELARRRAERRFQAAFEHAPIGVALTGVRGPRRGRFLQTNLALDTMVGREPGELFGTLIEALSHPSDVDRTEDLLGRLDVGEPAMTETRFIHRDGQEIWVLVSSTPVPGEAGEAPEYCVTQVLDISERKRFEGQLRHLADHDALTGLLNRHRFEEELDRVLSEARRYGRRGALLLLDLDGFKHVNDRFGHAVGDDLVRRIGSLLRESVRETDIVARLGGDEFAVLLHEASEADAIAVAEGLLEAVRRRGVVMRELRRARVTGSIGIAGFDGECDLTGAELVGEADVAMYDAKSEGRNRAVVFDRGARTLGLPSPERRSWLARLHHAVEHDRFELHAQPIVGIVGNGIPRYELLLRLRGDDGDLIPPSAFLLNAERLELMGSIDRWVLRQAVKLLHEQTAAGNRISLAVNLSGRTMNDSALSRDLEAMLGEHPIPDGLLVIEVTETAAIVNIDRARQLAGELRRLGCRFALDDFGAGFASFLYLKHLDFDFLKIDGEFIRRLTVTPSDQLVVKAVVDIARGLGTKTVAEFVGDDETVELLRELGVDYGQGYHLGRPGPLGEVILTPSAPGLASPTATGVARSSR